MDQTKIKSRIFEIAWNGYSKPTVVRDRQGHQLWLINKWKDRGVIDEKRKIDFIVVLDKTRVE